MPGRRPILRAAAAFAAGLLPFAARAAAELLL